MNNFLDQVQSKRKEAICLRIIKTLDEYFMAFGKPMAMKILSAKYARALEDLGGFPMILDELKDAKLIQVFLMKSGAKLVYPGTAEIIMVPVDCVKL